MKNEEQSGLAFASYLLAGAMLQDSLLQSYRGFHLTFQSIFLAIGTGLTITILSFTELLQSLAAFTVLIALSVVGLVAHYFMRKVIQARGEDVNYWHEQLIEVEQQLPPRHRQFTQFKIHQKLRRAHSAHLQELLKPDAVVGEEDVHLLVERGLGHTRNVIDRWHGLGIFGLWIILLVIASVSVFLTAN